MESVTIEEIESYQLWEIERRAGVPEAQSVNPYWYGE